MILLTALAAFFAVPALAQEAGNATNVTEQLNATNLTGVLNETNVSVAAPVAEAAVVAAAVEAEASAEEEMISAAEDAPEAASTVAATESAPEVMESRFKQLSVYTGESTVLGKDTASGYTDVSATTDRTAVFTRDAGRLSPSTKLGISKVGTGEDRFVEVTSQAVGEWDLANWSLSSGGSTTFTFPSMILEEGAALRVHEGAGAASETDIYTNSSEPLWVDSFVSLLDGEGDIISTFDISAQPAQVKWVDPLASQIQF
ncbi:MAG: lamin tail domain-containing protein [Methanothrix sp.]|nr:lamin tail domain-containing protein [Methanothrix sp.]